MVTIKDIALEAGVSMGTVSRAINNEKGMGPETRERILAIAQRLNYHPNLQARGLVAKRPNALGIIIPRTPDFAFSNPYYTEVLKGIADKAREAGQYLVFSIAEEESYSRIYHHRLAAGIIVLANRFGDPWIAEAQKMEVPMVLIPGDPAREGIPSVDQDNADGSFQAINYLAALGHRRIGFLNGPPDSKYSTERFIGYRRALEKNRLPFQKELIWEFDFSQQGGYEGMKKSLSLTPPPTAVLVINDFSAMGALRAAKEKSFRVPEDVSIIGSGDVPFASMTDPPLTTVRVPYQMIGRKATETLLNIIRGKRLSRKHQILPVELVIRNSTCPPSRKNG